MPFWQCHSRGNPHPLGKCGCASLQSDKTTLCGLCPQNQLASSNYPICCLQDGDLRAITTRSGGSCVSRAGGHAEQQDRSLCNMRSADMCPRLQKLARTPIQSCGVLFVQQHSECIVACCGDAERLAKAGNQITDQGKLC